MSSINLGRELSLFRMHTDRGREVVQRDLAQLQEQMSTGRRVNRASDDAGSYSRARRLDVLTDRYDQYQEAIEAARPWVTHTQDRLDQMTELLQQAHEQGVRASNDTFSADDRADFARSIGALREELVANLNAKVGDEYLFAGNHTREGAPFDSAGAPTGLDVSGARRRQVGPGPDFDLAINISGERAHKVEVDPGPPPVELPVAQTLKNLEDALTNPGTAPYPLDEALGHVAKARDHITHLGAEAGNIARRLDASAQQLDQSNIEYESRRSELEDADYVDVMTRFQSKQNQLQAALQMTASVRQTSLLDFLR